MSTSTFNTPDAVARVEPNVSTKDPYEPSTRSLSRAAIISERKQKIRVGGDT